MPSEYDLCVVGAGVAGLYAAYEWKKRNPNGSFVIVEATTRAGGRILTNKFGGIEVPLGAGIGRLGKDRLLASLIAELGLPVHEFPRKIIYGPGVDRDNVDITDVNGPYQTLLAGPLSSRITFKTYAQRILGKDKAAGFVTSLGYTDMLRENALDVVKHYGLDDNVNMHGDSDGDGCKGFVVPWKTLIASLVRSVGSRHIRYETMVTGIKSRGREAGCRVEMVDGGDRGHHIFATKVIVAVTVPVLRRLFPMETVYAMIEGQPFLRVYAMFEKKSRAVMASLVTSYMVVKGPLQKIIPMDAVRGIYMIAYSDNESAMRLAGRIEDTIDNRNFFAGLVEDALGVGGAGGHGAGTLRITKMLGKFWDVGTHYVRPGPGAEKVMEQARRPMDSVYVVGEAVALYDRGWTEGALESVKTVIDLK
jgi:hypothetical protein